MPANPSFHRDRLTWFGYLMLAYYTLIPSALGPLMPLLRSELHLSYAWGGLHLTALSLGILISGLSGERLISRIGRRAALWSGAIGIAAGVSLIAIGNSVTLSLLGAFLMGWLGAQVQINVQAILSDHHGEARATALTEANIAASLSASISPLFIALCVTFGLSWRTALFFQPIALAILAVVFWRVSLPSRIRPSGNIQEKPAIKLPSLYWLCWTAIILFVAIEWCLMVWGADYMVSDQGLNPAQAAAVMSVYAIVSVAGRVIGSRLTLSIPVSDILILALVSCAIGFPVFWLINLPGLAIIGFLLAGIGIANLFPMVMTLAIGAAPDQTDLASTRISLAVGIAGLSAPLLLGWLADQSGISLAYGIVFVFILIGFVLAREIRSRNHSRPKPENDQQQAL